MNETLTLNDGTELAGHLLERGEKLYLYVTGVTLREAFELLDDPEKTKVIQAERYGAKTTVRGYKRLFSISDDNGADGMVCAGLRKK